MSGAPYETTCAVGGGGITEVRIGRLSECPFLSLQATFVVEWLSESVEEQRIIPAGQVARSS